MRSRPWRSESRSSGVRSRPRPSVRWRSTPSSAVPPQKSAIRDAQSTAAIRPIRDGARAAYQFWTWWPTAPVDHVVELDHAVVGRSEEALLLVGRHVRVDRVTKYSSSCGRRAAPASGRGGSRGAGRPGAPREGGARTGSGSRARSAIGAPRRDGGSPPTAGRTAVVQPSTVGCRSERLPRASSQVLAPRSRARLERRLALGQLVLGVPRDLRASIERKCPSRSNSAKASGPQAYPRAALPRQLRRWRWSSATVGGHAGRRRGAAAPRRRAGRGSARARRRASQEPVALALGALEPGLRRPVGRRARGAEQSRDRGDAVLRRLQAPLDRRERPPPEADHAEGRLARVD